MTYFNSNMGRVKSKVVSVREDANWWKKLPRNNWLAFTIAEEKDEELLASLTHKIVSNRPEIIISSGTLYEISEMYFDEEIAWQNVNEKSEGELSIMTVSFLTLSEGLQYIIDIIEVLKKPIDEIVFIDFSNKYSNKIIAAITN